LANTRSWPSQFVIAIEAQSFEPPSTWTVAPVIQRAFARTKGDYATDIVGLREAFQRVHTKSEIRPPSVLVKFDMSVSTTPGA
jgi:hypothetical protein